MSSTGRVSASLVIRNDNYVFDKTLDINPSGWDNSSNIFKFSHVPPESFPSLKTFVNMANIAYADHDGSKCTSHDKVELDGFTFLSAVNNSFTLNGYYGVAYVNKNTRQVILSHRGTQITKIGALWADLKGIVMNSGVAQVSSAMTFAHQVVQYAETLGYEVFFTGHSLGGWLAQITTFSTMFLTLDEVTDHFVEKQSPRASVRMPYTVAFDSPGAFDILILLKKALFPQHLESTQEIDVETLPVEVFIFSPNLVNNVKSHIGRVIMLDLEKAGVDTTNLCGAGTHSIQPVVELLNKFEEEDAVMYRVIDYRVQKLDLGLNSWDLENQSVQFDKSCVPLYFFSNDERKFLNEAKQEFPLEGQFEGFYWEDEKISNDLIRFKNGEFSWRLTGKNESELTCKGWDRREFIPRVRHTVRCLRQRGTLWWNPKKFQLPASYMNRRISPTATLQQLTQAENTGKPFTAKEVLQQDEVLVLLVDPPGMGKSSAVTKLEMDLRLEVSWTPRVIVRLNLNTVQDILEIQNEDMATDDLIHPTRFLEKFAKHIKLQQTLPEESIPLYVLLDGLDEVCPLYEQTMLRLLKSLLTDNPHRLFIVEKLILTTRPHLQKLIEDQFSVKANSLLPFELVEQFRFLRGVNGSSFEAERCLYSLPDTARDLMGNPLMLSMFAQIIKSKGTETIANMFDLYSQFVAAKHKLHVVEKEEAEPAKMSTQQRVKSMLDDNLRFYFACAVEDLISSLKTKTTFGKKVASYMRDASLEQSTGRKLKELISYGLLLSDKKSGCRFQHRTFAEFFYAQLVTTEVKEYKKNREVLFGKMYEHDVAHNVGRFVREILLKRRDEQRESESRESFPRWILQEEEAALYLGKERLQPLANGWINSLEDKGKCVKHLLWTIKKPLSPFGNTFLSSPLKEVPEELAGADDKESALLNFYDGNLFPFLCGRSVLLSLDYSDPDIFESMKYDKRTIQFFLEWLCGLGDRSWVRAKVFGMKEHRVVDGGEHPWEGSAESAEVILMFAVRSDDIHEFLSHEEISAAVNSLDSVVKAAWRVEDVEVGRVQTTLQKYVDPHKLNHSLLIHLRTVDDFLFCRTPPFSHIPWNEVRRERQQSSFEWSWWYAEVFSRKDVLSCVTDESSRVPNIHSIGWRAVRDAWGEEFEFPREQRLNLTRPPHEGKTLLDIKEGDLEFATFFCNEAERGEVKLEEELMEVMKGMIFGKEPKRKILNMLERRLFMQRNAGTSASNCSSQETNILEQLFKSVEIYTTLFDTIQAKLNSSKDPVDIMMWSRHELNTLWAWLPAVVRYSGETKPINLIIERLATIRKYSRDENLRYLRATEKEYFGNAARSLLLANSSEAIGSSSISQTIRSFLRGLETEPDSLLKVLLETDEGELRTLIKENSHGTTPTVSYTPLGPVVTSLLHRDKFTSDGSVSTLPFQPTMESPWNAESVAVIFTELIETSPCFKLPGALAQFLSSFPPDLVKQALLTIQVYECFQSKCRVDFRKYIFVNTERLCSLRAVFRHYFVVFGEDLRWIESTEANVDLLTLLPVEMLSALEDEEETVVDGFPPLPAEVRLSLVTHIERKLRIEIQETTLSWLSQSFSYNRETDWERLLQTFHLISRETYPPIGRSSTSQDHNHDYQNIVDSRLLLIRVWMKHFGAEETRRAADEQKLWEWLRKVEQVPRGEYLHLAVEVGSLEGVKTFAWPGLLKWKNKGGKTTRDLAVELWGAQHEISQFLEERFQAVRAFHDDQ